MGVLARTPIEPARFNVNLTLYDHVKNGTANKKKRVLVCLDVDVVITQTKTLKRPSAITPKKTSKTTSHPN